MRHAEHDPQRDRKAMEALGRWLMRFTPVVALAGENHVARAARPGSSPKKITGEPPVPQGIFLDLTGCEHVFGGIDNLVCQISTALKRLRIHARVAVAPTPGAAHAIAMAGQDGTIVASPEQLQIMLAPLPPIALPSAKRLRTLCIIWGCLPSGSFGTSRAMCCPRDLEKSCCSASIRHWAEPEPLVPLEHPSPVEARMDFDGVVWSLEAIWAVFQQLIGQIIAQLIRRGCGRPPPGYRASPAFRPAGEKNDLPVASLARSGGVVQFVLLCDGRRRGTKARRHDLP